MIKKTWVVYNIFFYFGWLKLIKSNQFNLPKNIWLIDIPLKISITPLVLQTVQTIKYKHAYNSHTISSKFRPTLADDTYFFFGNLCWIASAHPDFFCISTLTCFFCIIQIFCCAWEKSTTTNHHHQPASHKRAHVDEYFWLMNVNASVRDGKCVKRKHNTINVCTLAMDLDAKICIHTGI